jgi:hypothetical protein
LCVLLEGTQENNLVQGTEVGRGCRKYVGPNCGAENLYWWHNMIRMIKLRLKCLAGYVAHM